MSDQTSSTDDGTQSIISMDPDGRLTITSSSEAPSSYILGGESAIKTYVWALSSGEAEEIKQGTSDALAFAKKAFETGDQFWHGINPDAPGVKTGGDEILQFSVELWVWAVDKDGRAIVGDDADADQRFSCRMRSHVKSFPDLPSVITQGSVVIRGKSFLVADVDVKKVKVQGIPVDVRELRLYYRSRG